MNAGARYTRELRVPPETEGVGTRHVSICFRSRWFGARVGVWRRPDGNGSKPGERACVQEIEPYPSHVCPQRLALPLGREGCTLELEFDNSDSWVTALEVVCDATVE